MFFFGVSASESSVSLVDVDGDGLDDVLVGVTSMEQFKSMHALLPDHTSKEACSILGLFMYTTCLHSGPPRHNNAAC